MKPKDIHLLKLFYNEGLESQKKVIKFGDFKPEPLGFFGKLRAKRAIHYFQQVLAFEKNDFRLYFFIGKNYQYLGQLEKATYYLEKAGKINTYDAFIPFETSIVAAQSDDIEKAINLITEAIRRNHEDAEMVAVHAMYLAIRGDFRLAQSIINNAFKMDPRNNFIIELKVIIDKVNLGHLTQPTLKSLFNQ